MSTLTVLVATTRTQGQRGSDFIACTPGELVDIASPCDRDRGNPDGGCGCTRAFTGLDSRQATTTAEVVARPMSVADHIAALHASLLRAGFPDEPTTLGWAQQAARDLNHLAASFPLGAVLERRGEHVVHRA